MTTLYDDDGFMIIPSPIYPEPSMIWLYVHEFWSVFEWYTFERLDALNPWRVVDARPGTHHWPIGGPKGEAR